METRLKSRTSVVLGCIIAMFGIDLLQCLLFLFCSMPAPPENDQDYPAKSSGLELPRAIESNKINSVAPITSLPKEDNRHSSIQIAKKDSFSSDKERLLAGGIGGNGLSMAENSGTHNYTSPTSADGNQQPPESIAVQGGQDPAQNMSAADQPTLPLEVASS